jgi:hypothetical protein|tara:strand:+ start:1005 stop:1430 length:426 start_codon:yes stop_codon:yes gene_type:complete
MNDVSYTVLKLANGEDIICEVDFEQYNVKKELTKRVYEIQNPLLITHTKEMSPEGVREGLSLSRWFQPFTEQKYFSIPATTVVTSAAASPGLSKYYEYVLKRIGDEYDEIVTEEKDLDDYSNDDIYDELLDEYETPSKAIH